MVGQRGGRDRWSRAWFGLRAWWAERRRGWPRVPELLDGASERWSDLREPWFGRNGPSLGHRLRRRLASARPPRLGWPRADAFDRGRWTWPLVAVGAIGVAGVVAIGVAMTIGGLDQPGSEPTSAVGAATDAPGLAGEGGGFTYTAIDEPFDSLAMDSTLSPPWVVSRPGRARVVALPTSVDRSVRIRSSANGEATSACRPAEMGAGTRAQLRLDVLVGGLATDVVPILTLEGGETALLTIGVDPLGGLIAIDPSGAGAGTPAGASDGWRRLQVLVDPGAETIAWEARDASGAAAGSGTSSIEIDSSLDRICLFSPAGTPRSWIAVDDLIVQG